MYELVAYKQHIKLALRFGSDFFLNLKVNKYDCQNSHLQVFFFHRKASVLKSPLNKVDRILKAPLW